MDNLPIKANLIGALVLIVGVAIYILLVGLGVKIVSHQNPDLLDFTFHQNVRREPAQFHLNEPVQVEALFYNKSGAKLTFTALVFWKMVSPAGNHNVLQLSFQETIPQGCTEESFNNYAPEQVKRFTNEQFAKGLKSVTWQIEGTNAVTIPYAGGLQPFETEQFNFIPYSSILPLHNDEDKLSC